MKSRYAAGLWLVFLVLAGTPRTAGAEPGSSAAGEKVAAPGKAVSPPQAPPAVLAPAMALSEARKFDEARAAFEKIAASFPGDATANYYLGDLALRRDDPGQAVVYFERASTAAPRDARVQNGLGEAYGRTAQKAGFFSKLSWARKTKAAFERAVELDPRNIDYRMNVLEYCRQAPGFVGGGFDQAYAQAAEIKKLDPVRGSVAYAILETDQQKYADAFAELEAALGRAPDSYALLYHLGRLCVVSGLRPEEGISSLKHCESLRADEGEPNHANVEWNLGLLLQKKGDLSGARTAYQTALRMDPHFSPAAQALEALPSPSR